MENVVQELTLTSYAGPAARYGEPVTIGIPLERKILNDEKSLELLDSQGHRIPCDTIILDRWPDNSARWALLAFRADIKSSQTAFKIQTVSSRGAAEKKENPKLCLKKEGDRFTIDTGPVTFTLAPGIGWPIRSVYSSKYGELIDSASSGMKLVSGNGASPSCLIREVAMEAEGSVRAVANCRGSAPLDSNKRIEIDWRIEFFASLPIVIVHVTMRNPHRAMHPGGFWELGDPGSLLLKQAEFKLSPYKVLSGASAWCSPELEKPFNSASIPFDIYQDSSGGENWKSHNHINREGRVPAAYRGYRIGGKNQTEGLRATPIASLDAPGGRLTLATRHFWQNFPKSLEVTESGISYGLFPRQWDDLHELQGGEQKTHIFAISFTDDGISETPLEWFRQPLVPSLNPDLTAKTEALPCFTPDTDSQLQYIELLNSAIKGPNAFEQKREAIDEYGWRHFGDQYGDHEAVYSKGFQGPGPLVSHYNNQYDPIAGFCYHWLRSGDPRWWFQFNELAAHIVDIDIYHTQEDKAAYNHGLFWHTFHYIDAGRATHRSYPRIGKSNGGGPSNEHIYASGLRMHYLITGNTASRYAAVGLAQFVIDIDDGTKTVFRWLSRGNTGLASHSGSPLYHGPGRGSGNAVNALIDGFRLTRERRFLDKAEQLIRRVIHPQQNIDSLNLKDIERKWFYTMFLQALGNYLDLKIELGEIDKRCAYARQSLLHYAHWMAENEYLYLERPETLEYPTETWAAQDLRKAMVFDFAGKYSEAKDKSLFQERAEYFYSRALEMLEKQETRTLVRPMVLLLTQGFAHAWFKKNAEASAPLTTLSAGEIGSPENFVPQKTLAIRNAKRIILLSGIVCLAAIAALVWHFLF